tara:strand:+ start:10570 stop:11325 length:756 start_codon:yes stop_codon:yes gene_type:complete
MKFIILSIRYIIGYFNLKKHMTTKKNSFFRSFKDKKVLVLGSGPSLDNLTQDLINKYEYVVFLNASFRASSKFNFENLTKILFTADGYRLSLMESDLAKNRDIKIIFLGTHLQKFRTIKRVLKNNSFAHFLKPKYTISLFGKDEDEKDISFGTTASLLTFKLSKLKDMDSIWKEGEFPVFPHTVALPAIYYLISSGCSQIDVLGCDFSSGRSKLVLHEGVTFKNDKIAIWVGKLHEVAKKEGIKLNFLNKK